jgi:hypothetical protein
VAVSYLEYLETSAIADPRPDVLIRLADALGTTAAALHGGGLGLPPGQRQAAGHPVLTELTPAGCRELLAPGGVGRFLFVTDRGPPQSSRLMSSGSSSAHSPRPPQAMGSTRSTGRPGSGRRADSTVTGTAGAVPEHGSGLVLRHQPRLCWSGSDAKTRRALRTSRTAPTAARALGLAIVQAIAQAHGGQATARNRSGGGAAVTVELPGACSPPG